jgi:hypothetical protein
MAKFQTYIVTAKNNMAVCHSLKEVFQFLNFIQEYGITYANILGTDQAVRLTENGFWVWTTPR